MFTIKEINLYTKNTILMPLGGSCYVTCYEQGQWFSKSGPSDKGNKYALLEYKLEHVLLAKLTP